MHVKVVVLKNGDNLIAQYEHNTDDVVLINPVRLVPVSQEQFAFVPWIVASEDEKYYLKEEDILTICTPHQQVYDMYCKHFGLIVTPSKKLIV